MRDGYQKAGFWVSGLVHLGLIIWALLGAVLLRPQPSQSVQVTQVATMSGAEFAAYSAASRGSGPVSPETANAPEISAPETETAVADAPAAADRPDAGDAAQELAQPDPSETEPDLSDFENRQPVSIATSLPVLGNPGGTGGTVPDTPLATIPPAAADQPDLPEASAQDQVADTVAPRSPLALDRSARPPVPPDGLVERHNERLAQQAAEAAALEAERLAAEQAAQRAAEQQAAEEAAQRAAAERAEEQRQEAERLAAEQEARAEAERQAEAEAERQRQEAEAREESARQAEQLAREEEERRLAAEREAAEREAAEREAAERAAVQEAADRQALEDALREAQNTAPGTVGAETAPAGETAGNIQRIEGGTGASVEQDPLAAALSEALSGQGNGQQSPPTGPEPNANRFLPRPITPRPLDNADLQPGERAPSGQPLSISEREAFRVALTQCWNRGALSVEASQMAVSVRFRLNPDGRPAPDSAELIESQPGSAAAIENAFNVARRAILECGRAGFPLPREKYMRWQQVIVDFRPEGINFQ